MNALTYMKNLGKSVGYASADVLKEYNPGLFELADSAKDLGTDLYQSIKDFRSNVVETKDEKSFKGIFKDTVNDLFKNTFEDLKTGNIYNKSRKDSVDDAAFDFGDFNFDDDFGNFDDFDFNDDDSSAEATMASDERNARAIIRGTDIVGEKLANTVVESDKRSSDYIVKASRQSSKAIYNLTERGFGNITKGLAAVNANVANVLKLSEPLNVHIENSRKFYEHSTAFQDNTIKLLQQIVDNTKPRTKQTRRSDGSRNTIEDLLTSNGGIDFSAYADMVKENTKSLITTFKGMLDMVGGIEGASKQATASPLSGLLVKGIKMAIPTATKEMMKEFNNSLGGFFASALGRLRDKSFGIFDLVKDAFLPKNNYRSKINPGKYEQGPIDWDGQSKKAITEIIPEQLSFIVSALTGRKRQIFDYKNGKWIDAGSIKNDFEKYKKDFATRSQSDFIDSITNVLANMKNEKYLDDKRYDQMVQQLLQFNAKAFHDNNSEFLKFMNNDFGYASYGMDKETWEALRDIINTFNKNGKRSIWTNYAGNMYKGRDSFGNELRDLELSGNSPFARLFNGIEKDGKTSGLLGVDKYNNDIFFYLQGIYLYTKHVSDNLPLLVSRSGKIKGSKMGKNSNKLKNVSTLTAKVTDDSKSNIDNKYKYGTNESGSTIDSNILSVFTEDYIQSTRENKNIDLTLLMSDPELKKYFRDKEMAKKTGKEFKVDDEKEEQLNKILYGGNKANRIKNKIENSSVAQAVRKVSDAISGLLHTPMKAVESLMAGAEVSMQRLIFGKESDDPNEKGFVQVIKDGLNKTFDSMEEKLHGFFERHEKARNLWNKIRGTKNEEGKYENGFLSNWLNSTDEELGKAGKWFKGAFTEPFSDNGEAASGRKVTKSGVVSVSEGEMIIPAELNPFYKKKINKSNQRKTEINNARKFFGFKFNGDTGIVDGIDMDGETYNDSAESENNGKGKTIKDNSVLGMGKKFFRDGFSYIAEGMGKVLDEFIPKDEKAIQKEKSTIADLLKAGLKDAGVASGAMTTGAIIGGGVSLLTGGLISPILSAGIGAAAGLTMRSKAVQNVLFGYTGEDGTKHEGILKEKTADFIKEKIPTMAKGATVGGVAGLFLGSPVLGAVLGSTVGYVTKSEQAKRFLFGNEEHDDGIMSRELQKKIKQAIPGISAGAIAGMIAGPFSLPVNIMLGSALGYATTTNKFKEKLFGKENEETGKREGGLIGLVKENFFNPIVGIFDKLSVSIRDSIKDNFHNLTKTIRKFIVSKLFAGKIFGKVARTAGRVISKVAKTPFNIVAGGLRRADNWLEGRALKKGRSIKSRKLGRNLTAEERLALRDGDASGKFGTIDSILQNFETRDQAESFKSLMSQLYDPTAQYDKEFIKARGNLKNALKNGFNSANASGNGARYRSVVNKIYKLTNNAQFVKAKKLVTSLNYLSESEINSLLSLIDKQRAAYEGRRLSVTNANAAKREIVNATGYKQIFEQLGFDVSTMSDSDIDRVISLTQDELDSGRLANKEEKEKKDVNKTITDRIPNLLEAIARHLIYGENVDLEQYGGSPLKAAVSKTAPENKNKSVLGDEPRRGDTKVEEGKKYIYDGTKWAEDISDTDTREKSEKEHKIYNAIMNLPIIGSAVSKFGGAFDWMKTKLFGDKENGKDGLFSKIFGSEGLLGGIFSAITGVNLKGLSIGTALSTFARGAVWNVGVPAGLAYLFLSKKGNEIMHKVFSYGNPNSASASSNTYNDATGARILRDENGNLMRDEKGNVIDENGNIVNTNDISNRRGDIKTAKEMLIDNTVRGITGTRSLVGEILRKNNLTKGLYKKAALNINRYNYLVKYAGTLGEQGTLAVTRSISDDVLSGVFKIGKVLNKIPIVNKLDWDGIANKISAKVAEKLASKGAKELAKLAANAVIWIKVAFIATDFITGYEDASATLGIKEPSKGWRVMAGLMRVIKNFIPIIGSLIPDNLVIDIFADYIAPALGMDISEFKAEREAYKKEVDEYNEANGTNYSVTEYTKQVREDYTFTERTKNAASSTWEQTKVKFGNMKSGIKEKGFSGYMKSAINNMGISFMDAYNEEGGGIAGFYNAMGTTWENLLPGVLGEIAKANSDIKKYASKGDIKSMWAVSLKDFSKKEAGEDGVEKAMPSLFSRIFGQIPLIMTKVTRTPMAFTQIAFTKIKGLLGIDETSTKNGVNYISKTIKDLLGFTKNGDLKGLNNYNVDTGNDKSVISLFAKATGFVGKTFLQMPTTISWMGHTIYNDITSYIKGIKNDYSTMKKSIKDLDDLYTEGGKTKDIILYELELGNMKNDPLYGIYKFIFNISQIFYTTMSAINDINPVEKLKDMKDGFVNWFKGDSSSSSSSTSGKGSGLRRYAGRGSGTVSQIDPKFNTMKLGDSTVGESGCAPAVAAMVTGNTMEDAVKEAEKYQTEGGTDASYFADYYAKNNKTAQYMSNKNDIANSIASGTPTALLGQDTTNTSKENSPFGPDNHFVLATGFDENGALLINDPESKKTKKYNADLLNNVSLGIGAEDNGTTKTTTASDMIPGLSNSTKNTLSTTNPVNLDLSNPVAAMAAVNANNKNKKNSTSTLNTGLAPLVDNTSSTTNGTINGFSLDTPEVILTGLGAKPNAVTIWKYFINKGYSPAAVAGLMGNLYHESHLDPTCIQGGGKGPGAGIAQWENYKTKSARWSNLNDFAQAKGKDWTDLLTQLQFMEEELSKLDNWFGKANDSAGSTPTTFADWKKSKDVEMATRQFEGAYERAGKPAIDTRIGYAKEFYQTLGKISANPLIQTTGNLKDDYAKFKNASPAEKAAVISTVKEVNPDLATAGSYSLSSSSSSTDSEDNVSILDYIKNIFGQFGKLFTGGKFDLSEVGSVDGTSVSNEAEKSDRAITSSFSPYNGTYSSNGKSPMDWMRSIMGTLTYSQSGPRDPEKGSADCSSTVRWAVDKATNGTVNIGAYTGTQYESSTMKDVWYDNGKVAGIIPTNAQPNDILYFRSDKNAGDSKYPDAVGHTGIYIGDGKMIHETSKGGKGPRIDDVYKNSLIKVRRILDPNNPNRTYNFQTLSELVHKNVQDNKEANSTKNDMTIHQSAMGSGLLNNARKSISKAKLIDFNTRKAINNGAVGGASALDVTSIVPTKTTTISKSASSTASGISKEVALLLKTIITLIETMVTNTSNIDNIYELLSNYCSQSLGNQASTVSGIIAASKKSDDSKREKLESSLSGLKATVDQILAS